MVLASAAALVGCVAAAQAQVDPYATTERHATQNDLDTDYTPVAKEANFWTLYHGAEYPKTEVIEGSLTSFDTDLFDVSFKNLGIGLAAGSTCPVSPVQARGEPDAGFGARVALCESQDGTRSERVPTLYRYSKPENEDERWDRLSLPGSEEPGYIAAIAWIDSDRALIVGGTGVYPERELGATDQDQYGRSNAIEDPTDPDKADVAGKARAWLYTKSTDSVAELDLSSLRSDSEDRAGMRGLTALDCVSATLCFAGALGQIWEWQDGAFVDKRIDAQSPATILKDASLFRYRVKDISGASAYTAGCCASDPNFNTPRVIARGAGGVWSANDLAGRANVTPPVVPGAPPLSPVSPLAPIPPQPPLSPLDPLPNPPQVKPVYTPACVSMDPKQKFNDLQKDSCIGALANPLFPITVPIPPPVGNAPIVTQESADGLNGQTAQARQEANEQIDALNEAAIGSLNEGVVDPLNGAIGQINSGVVNPANAAVGQINSGVVAPANGAIAQVNAGIGQLNAAVTNANKTRREVNDKPTWPDSVYAVSGGTVVLTPGAPEQEGEKSSVITTTTSSAEADLTRSAISTTRLFDLDGDAVGELRSTERPGLGARGLVVASIARPTATDAVNLTLEPPSSQCYFCWDPAESLRPTPEEIASGWEPIDEDKLEAAIDSRHYLLPSYTANAIDIVGTQEDGWAVGDHGAILRLSSSALAATEGATEPQPPNLGAPKARPLSERGAYESSRPELPASGGLVPGIGAETTHVDEPQMVAMGKIGFNSAQVVMSRDGTEGWAIGNDANGAAFAHYDGAVWSRCDPVGIPGVAAPDPACEAMAPLLGWRDSNGSPRTTRLEVAARVPLEYDPDPSNDDELEIVAMGDGYRGPETDGKQTTAVLRYRDGRWRFEDAGLLAGVPGVAGNGDPSLTFTNPNDGWLVHQGNVSRFTGSRWVRCLSEKALCGDPDGRIPQRLEGNQSTVQEVLGVTAAAERVYLFGRRHLEAQSPHPSISMSASRRQVPLIIYRDPGGVWTDGSGPGGDGGGFDPGFADPAPISGGRVYGLSVAHGSTGFEGWAVGTFGTAPFDASPLGDATTRIPPEAALMQLGADGWKPAASPGAFDDYMRLRINGQDFRSSSERLQVSYPAGSQGSARVFIAGGARFLQGVLAANQNARIFQFNVERERFEQVDSARPRFGPGPSGDLSSMAPDGRGGFWAVVGDHAFHYTDEIPTQLFEETPNPAGIHGLEIRDIEGGPDGSLWLATDSDRVFRFDRLGGWEESRIGWDPGRVIVRASKASAIAIGPGGEGLLVGEGGRIGRLSAESVSLDPAAGRSCALGDPVPCGTSRDLNAVDIAPDGSALAAGDRLALLWRPPGGEFRAIARPSIAAATDIELLSFPAPNRAYLYTNRGIVFRGEMSAPGDWTWAKDNTREEGEFTTASEEGHPFIFNDLAIDASGHGYAVGYFDGPFAGDEERGIAFERTAAGAWRRLAVPYPPGYPGDLSAVELAASGEGYLIGGSAGLILTGAGSELRLARPADFGVGAAGPVIGFAYLPGSTEGSVDAWAAVGTASGGGGLFDPNRGDERLLRYGSDPGDPLLDAGATATALSDAPPHAEGELALGAFGKSDCETPESEIYCAEMAATTTTNELISERIVDALASRRDDGALDLAVLSGDAIDSPGYPTGALGDYDRVLAGDGFLGQTKHRRYRELVLDELDEKGVPVFGAIGGQDLSDQTVIDPLFGNSQSTKPFHAAGENYYWRESFAGEASPWGSGEDVVGPRDEGLEFTPAPGSEELSLRLEDQTIDADGEGVAPEQRAAIGGAATHYAVDALRDGEPVARIVVVDTSMGSLAASEAGQQPQELGGTQIRFLERMLCRPGATTTVPLESCTREPGQRSIVVSNTPTYSYGPGALTHTSNDAASFEALMLRHDVDLVVSGALGYNGLYYTFAPGIHEPCPGGDHPEGAPRGDLPECAGATGAQLPDATAPLAGQGVGGAYPTLIASGAGGKFGPNGDLPADGAAGQWHGYSIARLMPGGEVVVEQRPILDWIGVDATEHTLSPRATLQLHGWGRSPISTTSLAVPQAFHYEIENAAITHRYELLLADPREPWLACEASDAACVGLYERLAGTRSLGSAAASGSGSARDDMGGACEPYLCLPENVATIDDQSGEVEAGNGKYPDTFAIAMLSVDEKAATWPLVFKRSPSFIVSPAVGFPAIPSAPAGTGAAPSPPAPPNPPAPQIPQVNSPSPPLPPPVAPLQAAQPPEPQPPAPPVPPPPTEQPSPLSLTLAPPGIAIATPTAVIQPPTPPVNPAPPGGARREARQRQAAAQKSGADSDQESQAQDGAGDMADAPRTLQGAQATRQDPARAQQHNFTRGSGPAFTPLNRSEPEAGAQALIYTGGITLLAFALALGHTHGRPTPRRQTPDVPAPAFSQARIRNR